MSRMMVYRGPQWVQLVNGYPKRRFAGSPKSRQHSSHVPASGGTSANAPLSSRLSRIENPSPPRTSISETLISFISADLGGSSFSVRNNSSSAGPRPSISMVTPEEELKTNPVSPSEVAVLYTNGRNPTPCTTPRTRMCLRLTSSIRPSPCRLNILRIILGGGHPARGGSHLQRTLGAPFMPCFWA